MAHSRSCIARWLRRCCSIPPSWTREVFCSPFFFFEKNKRNSFINFAQKKTTKEPRDKISLLQSELHKSLPFCSPFLVVLWNIQLEGSKRIFVRGGEGVGGSVLFIELQCLSLDVCYQRVFFFKNFILFFNSHLDNWNVL